MAHSNTAPCTDPQLRHAFTGTSLHIFLCGYTALQCKRLAEPLDDIVGAHVFPTRGAAAVDVFPKHLEAAHTTL